MDAQLQELLETIKTEGVQTAEKQAEQILASAEEKAREIILDSIADGVFRLPVTPKSGPGSLLKRRGPNRPSWTNPAARP